jgi:hypothetical protein
MECGAVDGETLNWNGGGDSLHFCSSTTSLYIAWYKEASWRTKHSVIRTTSLTYLHKAVHRRARVFNPRLLCGFDEAQSL